MFRLMYMSTGTRHIPDEELEEILEISRVNNSKKEVTGLLLVKGRTFLQCLEGEEIAVLEVYHKIVKDDRHTDIIDLMEEDIQVRLFPDWSMGYRNLKSLDDIKSKKIKEILDFDQLNLAKEDISEIIKEFVVSN